MINCNFASTAHKIFAFKLEMLVDGNDAGACDPAVAADHGACDLGKWLVAHAGELGHLPHFAELDRSHRHFHETVGEMLRRFHDGDVAGARAIEQGEFRSASDEVLLALEIMGAEVGRDANLG